MTSQPLALDTAELPARRGLDLLVLDLVRIQAWDRILFVECGDGWIAEEAWRRALRAYVCGLDTSVAQVERAKQLREVGGKLEFMPWDGRTLPVPDAVFNRVVAIFSPAPPQPTPGVLRDLRRVLRAEGEAYLLHPAAGDADLRLTLAQAGWTDVCELARSQDDSAVLVRARCTPPLSSDQKIV
jgi:ubiquinone/menaquinone biosynthesis C-methylase UbiE